MCNSHINYKIKPIVYTQKIKESKISLQKNHTDGQQVHREVLIITNQGIKNQNHNETLFTHVRIAIIKMATNKRWQGYGEKGSLVHCWWECKMVQPLGEPEWRFH